jgi:hypothetical protein
MCGRRWRPARRWSPPGTVGEDRSQVAFGETVVDGGVAEGPVDGVGACEGGEGDRFGHLRPHPRHPGLASLFQPQTRAGADGQEVPLGVAARHRGPLQGRLGCRRVMARVDPGVSRGGHLVAGDLDGTGGAEMGDHDLVSVPADPHHLAGQMGWHGIHRPLPLDRRLVDPDGAGQSERGGVGMLGQRVQAGGFVGEHLDRGPPGHPVHPSVDRLAERHARRFERRPVRVVVEEVGVGGDQVGFRHPHRRLRPALGCRISGLAGVQGETVVTGRGDDVRVADRDPRYMVGGEGLLVIRQAIGRHTTEGPQGGVDTGDHRRQGLVADRYHHPKAGPRQPGAEQAGAHTIDDGPVAVVPLEPQPRLHHPRPVHPPVTRHERRSDLSCRATAGAFRAGKSHGNQLVVGNISADLALRRLHPLLELGEERVDQPGAADRHPRHGPGVTAAHPGSDGLVVTTGELAGITETVGQIKSFEYLHDLLGRLQLVPPWGSVRQTHPG